MRGSPAYMAPEILLRREITNLAAVDIYGVGCSALCCASRERELSASRSLFYSRLTHALAVLHDLAHSAWRLFAFFHFYASIHPQSPLATVNTDVGPDPPPPGSSGSSGSVELRCVDSRLQPLRILIQRARVAYEPVLGPRLPPPLATLLRACLAVDPAQRPSAAAARVTTGALASQADSWEVGDERGGPASEGAPASQQPPPLFHTPAGSTGSTTAGGSRD